MQPVNLHFFIGRKMKYDYKQQSVLYDMNLLNYLSHNQKDCSRNFINN